MVRGKVSKAIVAAFLSLLSLNSNSFGMDGSKNMGNEPIPREERKIADKDALIPYDCTYNVLVVADTVERMQKVTALLHNNKKDTKLGDLSSNLKNYESGKVYKAANNPNVNILCITLDDFNNQDSSYDRYWDLICQNTGFVYYVFKSKSEDDAECYEKLKKFYHKFNKHWCGEDLAYNENYDPNGALLRKSIDQYVPTKDRDGWFVYVLHKRELTTEDHRYIYFILDNDKMNCYVPPKNNVDDADFEDYVGRMPDARVIRLWELNDNFNANEFICCVNYKVPLCGLPFDKIKKNSRSEVMLDILKFGIPAIFCCSFLAYLGIKIYQNKKK